MIQWGSICKGNIILYIVTARSGGFSSSGSLSTNSSWRILKNTKAEQGDQRGEWSHCREQNLALLLSHPKNNRATPNRTQRDIREGSYRATWEMSQSDPRAESAMLELSQNSPRADSAISELSQGNPSAEAEQKQAVLMGRCLSTVGAVFPHTRSKSALLGVVSSPLDCV